VVVIFFPYVNTVGVDWKAVSVDIESLQDKIMVVNNRPTFKEVLAIPKPIPV